MSENRVSQEAATAETVARLEGVARELRAYNLMSIYAGKSGHPGGTLSILDVVTALYFDVLNHRPNQPDWPGRDRVFWSAGHKAPALYVALARAGYFPLDEAMLLRQFGARCQGHPHLGDLPGIEVSSGSLGQGLGIAVGSALAARLNGARYRVFCIMGDGEQQEGSIWEAAMSAGHYKLSNLIGIVDRNRLQIDGWVKDVMGVEPLAAKYKAFGWSVIEIDGHDMLQVLTALRKARRGRGRPTCIIADTVKGKGVSFMEDEAKWHGVPPNDEQFAQAFAELRPDSLTDAEAERLLGKAKEHESRVAAESRAHVPTFSRDYWWNSGDAMKVEMEPTRRGFGRGMCQAGQDPRVVTLHADISASICITDFEAAAPERDMRVFSVGIAEQNMMQVAAGLAKEGKIPVTGTYGVFASGRCWDQIRTTICYSNLNVKIAGAHGGISVGPDGATHQALEEISLMSVLPAMNLVVPADAVETEKATLSTVLQVQGPVYLRYAREATPVISTAATPWEFGTANVIRYRGWQSGFADAFETVLASSYVSEQEDLSIVACGPMVPEAMRAACILKEEFGIETRVLNVHTVKPLDTLAVIRAAETGVVLTAEEHQVGGFGNLIAAALLRSGATPARFDMVGIPDRFGLSGKPWELMQYFGLTGEHLAKRAKELHDGRICAAASAGTGRLAPVADFTLTCGKCGKHLSARAYLSQLGPPSDDICAECGRRLLPECTDCQLGWLLANGNLEFVCPDCR